MKKIGVCVSWLGGYGFIRDNKDELDYYVHWSSINDGAVRWNNLRVGDFVEFETGPGINGRIQAINVKRT